MALDTKQKRGSALLMGQPWRGWLAEPSGALPVASRISLRWWCSGVSPGPLVRGPWRIVAAQVYCPGGVAGESYTPGGVAGESYTPGGVAGEVQ